MSENRASTSVTRLLSLGLTPGKLRGLQRICNDNGTLTMVATDQNNSMIRMIKDGIKKRGEHREPSYHELVEAKIVLADALSKHASAVLVDGYYGAWNAMATMSLPRNTGLLVRVEKSEVSTNKLHAPLGSFEPGLGVRKLKLMGIDAVKLLAQYEPVESNSAEHQMHFVKQVFEDCQKHDILLLLEPPPVSERCAFALRSAVGKKPARACATIHSASAKAAAAAFRF